MSEVVYKLILILKLIYEIDLMEKIKHLDIIIALNSKNAQLTEDLLELVVFKKLTEGKQLLENKIRDLESK